MFSLSAVPEGPPSIPGIQPLTQQLFTKRLLTTGYRNGHEGYGSEQTQIPPQGAYVLGVSLQWLQAVLGCLEFPSRVFPFGSSSHVRARTRTHARVRAPQPSLVLTCTHGYAHAPTHTGSHVRARADTHKNADAHGLSCRPPPPTPKAQRGVAGSGRARAQEPRVPRPPGGSPKQCGRRRRRALSGAGGRRPARSPGSPSPGGPLRPHSRAPRCGQTGSVPGHRGHPPFSAIPSGRPDGRRGQVR